MNDMKRNNDNPENSKNVLNSLSLIDEAIDLSIQEEYFRFSGAINFDNLDYEEVLTESDKLFDKHTPIELKKRILILLAHLGTAESCRIIEKYLRATSKNVIPAKAGIQNLLTSLDSRRCESDKWAIIRDPLKISEGDLRDWALLSLKECRTFLESVLLKEEEGFISTGLGGEDNKLRYYFIVSSKDGLPFSETHKDNLRRGFEAVSLKYKSEFEEINFEAAYAIIGILIPMDAAVGDVIEEGISECNKMGGFLFPDYYVTNVKKPAPEEISKYLEEISRGKK